MFFFQIVRAILYRLLRRLLKDEITRSLKNHISLFKRLYGHNKMKRKYEYIDVVRNMERTGRWVGLPTCPVYIDISGLVVV